MYICTLFAALPFISEQNPHKNPLDQSKSVDLTFSQTSPGFYMSAVQVLKTLWEKEKLLITSYFCFSPIVFYPFGELSAIFIKLKIVVCKLFQFGRV